MSADRNLLFAVLALQADCVTREQFIDACTAWAANKTTPIDALMVQKGWLTPEDRADVQRLVERKLKKHGGNVRQSLAEVAGEDVRQSLAAVPDSDLRQSLAAGLPADFVGLATLPPPASSGPSRYSLSRVHATGGIGRVWLAHDTAMGRSVALKELRPERVGEHATIERFVKEARITGQLEHPGIVPIYELAHRPQDNEPFYTMRFIRGRTLAAAIRRFHDPKLPPPQSPVLAFRELLTAFLGACNAAAYAHSRGVIHRDLKPANIVLGDYGEVIVLDWGMAKVLPVGQDFDPAQPRQDENPAPQAGLITVPEPPPRIDPPGEKDGQTVAGLVMGTPAYMPPEQAEGRHDLHDQRTDVYALGAILYEILTGVIPFHAPNTEALLEKVCREPPPRPRARKPGVPPPLEAICLKALAKRREDRYPSALALADDVQHWRADEPVSCYAEPLLVRVGRWARKHKPVVATAAAVLFTTTVGLAVGLYFVNAEKNRTTLARVEAERREDETKLVLFYVENDVLPAAGPFGQQGDDVTLEQGDDMRLEYAVAWMEAHFKGRPLIEARLRMTMGESFHRLGDARLAEKQFMRAREIYTAKLGPDNPETLMSMNNLAGAYITRGQSTKALELLQQTLVVRARRSQAEPGNSVKQCFVAWTHGQLGEAEQARQDYAAARKAYVRSTQIFETLDKAGKLTNPFFRGTFSWYCQRLALSRKVEQAVRDLDFALKQPAAEVPGLLDIRVRFLLKEQKPAAAVESAAKRKQLAGDKPDQLYNAACLYAICAGADRSGPDTARLAKECADEALTLLQHAVAKGYKNAGHMKQDQDLAALRQRPDFQKLLAEMEGQK